MTSEPLPDGTDLNDLMAGEWHSPAEADEPDDEPKEMEDPLSLGFTGQDPESWQR